MFNIKNDNFKLHTNGKDGYKFYTFIPDPLCASDLKYQVDEELMNLLAKAHRILGLIEGMATYLPNITAIESVFLHKEAFLVVR